MAITETTPASAPFGAPDYKSGVASHPYAALANAISVAPARTGRTVLQIYNPPKVAGQARGSGGECTLRVEPDGTQFTISPGDLLTLDNVTTSDAAKQVVGWSSGQAGVSLWVKETPTPSLPTGRDARPEV